MHNTPEREVQELAQWNSRGSFFTFFHLSIGHSSFFFSPLCNLHFFFPGGSQPCVELRPHQLQPRRSICFLYVVSDKSLHTRLYLLNVTGTSARQGVCAETHGHTISTQDTFVSSPSTISPLPLFI